MNLKDKVEYESYQGKIPLLFKIESKVVYVKHDSEPPGLAYVVRCINKFSN
jgi:hypothetical protein